MRPMPPVNATRVHADRLTVWSYASWALATLTPPMKYSLSSLPASPCHASRVIGSLVTGVPAVTAVSISAS